MGRVLSRTGIPAAAAGIAILFDVAMARAIFAADETRVYLLGHPLNWECSFHAHTGLPCPTCGLTRSLILTLHGHLERAWHVAPGGPALALAVLLAAVGLLVLAAAQLWPAKLRGGSRWLEENASIGLRTGTIACASISIAIWLAGWVEQFSHTLWAVH